MGRWLKNDCWSKLFVALIGMCVVDLYLLYIYDDYKKWNKYSVKNFSDLIAKDLNKYARHGRMPTTTIRIKVTGA